MTNLLTESRPVMPTICLRSGNGEICRAPFECELADIDSAWAEVCGDLIDGVARKLEQNSEWQMELLDESERPVLRIRLVAGTL